MVPSNCNCKFINLFECSHMVHYIVVGFHTWLFLEAHSISCYNVLNCWVVSPWFIHGLWNCSKVLYLFLCSSIVFIVLNTKRKEINTEAPVWKSLRLVHSSQGAATLTNKNSVNRRKSVNTKILIGGRYKCMQCL